MRCCSTPTAAVLGVLAVAAGTAAGVLARVPDFGPGGEAGAAASMDHHARNRPPPASSHHSAMILVSGGGGGGSGHQESEPADDHAGVGGLWPPAAEHQPHQPRLPTADGAPPNASLRQRQQQQQQQHIHHHHHHYHYYDYYHHGGNKGGSSDRRRDVEAPHGHEVEAHVVMCDGADDVAPEDKECATVVVGIWQSDPGDDRVFDGPPPKCYRLPDPFVHSLGSIYPEPRVLCRLTLSSSSTDGCTSHGDLFVDQHGWDDLYHVDGTAYGRPADWDVGHDAEFISCVTCSSCV